MTHGRNVIQKVVFFQADEPRVPEDIHVGVVVGPDQVTHVAEAASIDKVIHVRVYLRYSCTLCNRSFWP